MNWYLSILSGVVQGLTEFLPISSSGHLVILHHFFKMPKPQMEFDIFLHVGTLGAVIFVFYKDIIKIFTANIKILALLIIATIPACILAIFFNEKIEATFNQVKFVGIGLLVTAFFLVVSSIVENFKEKRKEKINFLDAILIGISQALALFPGFSRSGLTISTALSLGISREEAVKFSFLLAILAISGAFVFKINSFNIGNMGVSFLNIILGTVVSFFVGILAIKIVLKTILAGKWYIFGIYCAFLGFLILISF
jgi:undecaprenyl-diphosphatase